MAKHFIKARPAKVLAWLEDLVKLGLTRKNVDLQYRSDQGAERGLGPEMAHKTRIMPQAVRIVFQWNRKVKTRVTAQIADRINSTTNIVITSVRAS